MATIKFTQGSTTWREKVELSHIDIYNIFEDIGNPTGHQSVMFEIFNDDCFYAAGEYPLISNEDGLSEQQHDIVQEILMEIEKHAL